MPHLWTALALCLLTLAAYSNSFTAGFPMDNRGLILQDTRIRAATTENLTQIVSHTYWWPYGESGLYRPFTTLSYLFNYAILGDADTPAGYHWLNFLLHAANVLLLYHLALRLAAPWRVAAALAALWAVHPVLTESVTNIAGRADLLAAMATLGGLRVYLNFTESRTPRRWLWLAALSAVTLAGVFAKESAVTLLGVIVLFELLLGRQLIRRQRNQARDLLLAALAMLLPIQLMLFQRAAVLWSSPPANFPFYDNPLVAASFLAGRLTALQVMGRYVALLAWPATLSSDYSWAQIPLGDTSAPGLLAWIALAAASSALVFLARRSRTLLFAAAAALLVFLPTANLLFPLGTIMAERFLYLPAIAFCACIAAALFLLPPRPAAAILALLLLASGARTWLRNADWQSDLTLGAAAVRASPASFKSHKLLAFALHEADARTNLDRVIAETETSLAVLNPLPDARNDADSYQRAGSYYMERSEASPANGAAGARRALELFQRARAIALTQPGAASSPAMAELLLRISEAQRRLGSGSNPLETALQTALDARRLAPRNPALHHQLAAILLDQGRREEAAVALMEGVLFTADTPLRTELLGLYRNGLDPQGCATMPIQGNTALNPDCAIVHRHLCAAAAGTIQLHLDTGRKDLAETMRATAIQQFHCAP
jgi:hypothetical protein